jgi:hypothetical protein
MTTAIVVIAIFLLLAIAMPDPQGDARRRARRIGRKGCEWINK